MRTSAVDTPADSSFVRLSHVTAFRCSERHGNIYNMSSELLVSSHFSFFYSSQIYYVMNNNAAVSVSGFSNWHPVKSLFRVNFFFRTGFGFCSLAALSCRKLELAFCVIKIFPLLTSLWHFQKFRCLQLNSQRTCATVSLVQFACTAKQWICLRHYLILDATNTNNIFSSSAIYLIFH